MSDARGDSKGPKVLVAEVRALPNAIDAVSDLLVSYGEVVRREPGNLVFKCHQVASEPERFVVYEVYADESAFQAHLAAPENAEVNSKLGPLVAGNGSVLTFLSPLD